jgi:hypothetical protein
MAERPEEEDEGGGGHASVREREGGGLGRADREAKAQEEWGERAGRRPRPRRLGRNQRWAQTQKEIPFEF